MKILQTIYNSYITVTNESLIDKFPKQHIKSEVSSLPKEVMLSEEEQRIIDAIEVKIEHLENNILNLNNGFEITKCYKNWSHVITSEIEGYTEDSVRYTYKEFNVDQEFDVTAVIIVNLEDEEFYIELRQSDMALPNAYESTDDIDYAVKLLESYIYNPEAYADYK